MERTCKISNIQRISSNWKINSKNLSKHSDTNRPISHEQSYKLLKIISSKTSLLLA